MTRPPGLGASQAMRAMLAQQGIFLDETPASVIQRDVKPENIAQIDREAIRAVLVERGAPARDLDWLVASCPSLEHAIAFEPTPWMLRDFTDYLDEQRTIAGLEPGAKGRP